MFIADEEGFFEYAKLSDFFGYFVRFLGVCDWTDSISVLSIYFLLIGMNPGMISLNTVSCVIIASFLIAALPLLKISWMLFKLDI